MIVIHDDIQGSPSWHAKREGKYSGSNSHKLLGSFGASEYAKATQSKFTGNFYTKRGHILEHECVSLYEQIRKTKVTICGFVTNDSFPTALYSPDGLTDDLVIEVKCFNEKEHMKMYNGDIPMKILAQVHFGMLICERKLAELVIYNPSLEAKYAFKIIPIKHNKNIADNFRRILA